MNSDESSVQTQEKETLLPHTNSPASTDKKAMVFKILTLTLIVIFLLGIGTIFSFGIYFGVRAQPDSGRVCERPTKQIPKPTYKPHTPVELTNVYLYNGRDPMKTGQSIYMESGKIKCVGDTPLQNCEMAAQRTKLDMKGFVVTPGLVDLHSHLGVYSFPDGLSAYQDGNEMTSPTTPYVRAVDALRASDIAIPDILAGGVTTSLILPGSGNVMGGEGVSVKLKQTQPKTVQDMIIVDQKRNLKMACGENPKRVYGSRSQLPMSRMGTAWVLRQKFQQALALKKQQQEWDCNPRGERPNNLEVEPLIALLNGDANLQMHCYEVVDMEMAIRVSKEFGYNITAFHHALEAYKIPNILKENNIAVATFTDHWGFKLEAYEASVHGPQILQKAGVKLILKTDHPVIHGFKLISEAARAYHHGLEDVDAINAITLNPAIAMGVSHRTGSIEVGKDADIVVWDRNPLLNGAAASKIFIEGIQEYSWDTTPLSPFPFRATAKLQVQTGVNSAFVVSGVKILTQDGAVIEKGAISVDINGIVTCVASECPPPEGGSRYALEGGIIGPGAVESDSPLGLVEINSESTTHDGNVPASMVTSALTPLDGIALNGKVLDAAFKGGVTTAIVKPTGNRLVVGQSIAYQLEVSNTTFIDDILIKSPVALHINIGASAKGTGGLAASVSGQFHQLRSLLTTPDATWKLVLVKNMTIAASVNRADHIASLLRLKKEFGFNLIIVGGAESFLLADKLAAAKIPVILTPKNGYAGWESLRSNEIYNIDVLLAKGVKVGVGIGDQHEARQLRFIAGMLKAGANMDLSATMAMITNNVAEAFGIEAGKIKVGSKADFVLYGGDPFEFGSQIRMVALGKKLEVNPIQN